MTQFLTVPTVNGRAVVLENSTSLVPAGVMHEYAGAAAPSGYLLCDGAAVSRTTFSALFAVVGTAYGAGDGSTTFNLPDRRGRVGMGAGMGAGLTERTRGEKLGSEQVVLTVAQMPSHGHQYSRTDWAAANNTAANGNANRMLNGSYSTQVSSLSGGDQPHPNIPPALVSTYIIKT